MARNSKADRETRILLHRRYLSYAVDLKRVMDTSASAILQQLEGLTKELLSLLNDSSVVGHPQRPAKLRRLLEKTRVAITTKYSAINKRVNGDIRALSDTEVLFTRNVLNRIMGIPFMGVKESRALTKNITRNFLLEGATPRKWWSRQNASTRDAFAAEIRKGLLAGDNFNEMVARVRGDYTGRRKAYKLQSGQTRYHTIYSGGVMSARKREAEALVRTALSTIVNKTREGLLDGADNVVEGVTVVVTLDNRTTPFCQSISGSSWDHNRQPIGPSGPYPGPPPYHWNCRTYLVPILKSLTELQRGNLSQEDRERLEALEKQRTGAFAGRGKRDFDMSYSDWLKSQSKKRQVEILGPARYRLFTTGKLGLRDMVNARGRKLTLRELRLKVQNNGHDFDE